MRIKELLSGLPHRWVRGEGEIEVTDVTLDSRRAGPGVVFVAVRGAKADGIDFVPEALGRGASVVLVAASRAADARLGGAGRLIAVADDRAALATMARNLRGRVDERLPVVGVTGTNGKTTTCSVISAILRVAGIRTGMLGTVIYSLGDEEIRADRTTPEAEDIHRYMERMVSAGCGACVMEVSSHSLELRRVHGIGFAGAVFTNLTRDHLDFHGTMEDYFSVKARLFDMLAPRAGRGPFAVVNSDDPYGRRLAATLASRADLTTMTCGVDGEATHRMKEITTDASGCGVTLATPDGDFTLRSALLGRPNVYNIAQAALAARGMGVGWEAIQRGVSTTTGVAGRMERVAVPGQQFTVVVDYAHTDDALQNLLATVRPLTSGKVICVFGCGGDRDRTKRPLMGAHAARLADRVIVTSDNPRSEDPAAIIEEILKGTRAAAAGATVSAEPDRRKAIETAIAMARQGDTVVIAGKGHETSQIIGDRVTAFDDRLVARAALEKAVRGERSGGNADS